jgi:hypothetical protein
MLRTQRCPAIPDAAPSAVRATTASRLAVVIGASVSSDAVGMVPTGGELTLFEAVGRARA